MAVEVRDAEPLEVVEEPGAEVVHHPLADPGGQDGLGVLLGEVHQKGEDERAGEEQEEARVAPRDRDVEGLLGEPGADERQEPARHQQRQCGAHRGPVGPHVADEPAEQRRVVGPGEGVLGLLGHAASASTACAPGPPPVSIALSPRRTQA